MNLIQVAETGDSGISQRDQQRYRVRCGYQIVHKLPAQVRRLCINIALPLRNMNLTSIHSRRKVRHPKLTAAR